MVYKIRDLDENVLIGDIATLLASNSSLIEALPHIADGTAS